METVTYLFSWLWWFVSWVLYILFWTWPLWYVSWLAIIVITVSARTEYVRSGGGLYGLAHAVWFAIRSLPQTMNAILRWLVMQIVLIAGLITKSDVMGTLPGFVRRWLGHGPVETRTVYKDRIVESVKWRRPPIKWRLLKTAFFVFVGYLLTRSYDNWSVVGPWITKLYPF